MSTVLECQIPTIAAAQSNFGGGLPPILIFGFWALVVAYVAMVAQATLLVAKKGQGVEVPVWVFAIVLLPFIGAIGAAAHYTDRKN